MNAPGNALLLVGSPRLKTRSTSESLGSYLMQCLERRGVGTKTRQVKKSLNSAEDLQSLLSDVRESDLVVASFPLYVDCLPAPLIRVLEAIAEDGRLSPFEGEKGFMALVNCGFPEAVHTQTAIAICSRFAQETGMVWLGGLGLGGGESFSGRPLVQLGFFARNVRAALELAAEAAARGERIPQKAEQLMARPLMPAWFYRWMGNLGWKREAKRRGTLDRLGDRPFER